MEISAEISGAHNIAARDLEAVDPAVSLGSSPSIIGGSARTKSWVLEALPWPGLQSLGRRSIAVCRPAPVKFQFPGLRLSRQAGPLRQTCLHCTRTAGGLWLGLRLVFGGDEELACEADALLVGGLDTEDRNPLLLLTQTDRHRHRQTQTPQKHGT